MSPQVEQVVNSRMSIQKPCQFFNLAGSVEAKLGGKFGIRSVSVKNLMLNSRISWLSSAYCTDLRQFALTHNPFVPGSSPGGPTIFLALPRVKSLVFHLVRLQVTDFWAV